MIKLIIYIVIGLLVLSFFGISLQHLIQSPTTQANFSFFWDLLQQGWQYLVDLITGALHTVGLDALGSKHK
ncbi:MAG: hypothetical protein JWN49_455 [Parcubacteria group bacterium]|nr:hypothetical protein [Parcubacteria group bacterium]